jgi:signal transduction histidine kinase
MDHPPAKVAILGAGKGGIALLDLLSRIPGIDIVGIADKNPLAPALARARELKIPVVDHVPDLVMNHGATLVVDVTGDPGMQQFLLGHRRPGVEIVGGAAAKLFWDLVQHESSLQAQLFQAERLAEIGSFAAGIAHDINNPLHLILALAELIRDEQDLPTVRDHANEIIEAVQRVSAISKDLTLYTRRQGPDDPIAVDLAVKLDEALKIAKHATTLLDLSIIKEYRDRPRVKARPEDLLHAFVNLLTNAIHAMDGRGTLTLGTDCAEGLASVTISDTGCGIPKENLERVFEPFFTTKPPGKGTGLGLSNVRTIVNGLRGRIFVDSQVGKGTTFRLIFPAAESG